MIRTFNLYPYLSPYPDKYMISQNIDLNIVSITTIISTPIKLQYPFAGTYRLLLKNCDNKHNAT